MPAYNAARTIAGAILSTVNQTYWNWELVIVDDGSRDALLPEIKQFGDGRIRYARLEQNAGPAAALNAAIALSQGRFVARMDADDYMEDWRLAEQVKFLMLEGLAVCGAGARKFGDEDSLVVSPATGSEIVDTFLVGNPFLHPTAMFDRDRSGADLRYDEAFRCEEDYELWSRLISRTNCGNLDAPVLRYRVEARGNANHPTKKALNKIALRRFAARMGCADVVPIDVISEFQMTRYVDEPGYRDLAAYARAATKLDLPRLGWLHGPLLELRDYGAWFAWFNDAASFTPYSCISPQER